MKKAFTILILFFATCEAIAQVSNVEEIFILPSVLSESSGVTFYNDRLISHNDSGNQNKLYEFDTISGVITREITIENATNVDWEDIAQDDSSIYISDIGNNNGSRTDLKIYKISKDEYLDTNSLTAEIISFNYSDQTDFSSNPNNTEWDAEALISFDENNLILLTKNWVSEITKAYLIPKDSGTYTVDPLTTSLTDAGLITGATYNELNEVVYLVGYNSILQPFVWIVKDFVGNDIFSGMNTKIPLTGLGIEQVESITHVGPNNYFMTSEFVSNSIITREPKLLSFSTNDSVSLETEHQKSKIRIYPNPVRSELTIDALNFASVEIYDSKSIRVSQSEQEELRLSDLEKGVYFVKVNLKNGMYEIKRIVKQ